MKETPREWLGWFFARQRGRGHRSTRYAIRVQSGYVSAAEAELVIGSWLYSVRGIERAPENWQAFPPSRWAAWHDDLTIQAWATRKCPMCGHKPIPIHADVPHRCVSGPEVGKVFWNERRQKVAHNTAKWIRRLLRQEGMIPRPVDAPRVATRPAGEVLAFDEDGNPVHDHGIEPPVVFGEERE